MIGFAAFLAWLDEQRRSFNFRKAPLITPPVWLYSPVSPLTQRAESMPSRED